MQLKLYLHLCMNVLIYLKNVMIVIVIVHVIVAVKKKIKNMYVLLINILNFVNCEEDSIILKETTKSYFNVEYINFFYLLQKAIDQIISKKLNLYDENACIREIDMLITMFINLYHNSNIDCNKKVENKIYNLYQHYYY